MNILRELNKPAIPGPADWFHGEVWVQALLGPDDSPSLRSARVSFASGARTAWHVHPRGQMIHVISGICAFQKWGEELQQVGAGDTVWFGSGEKHWHGSAPNHPMVHIAIQEADESGQVVTWMEHVS